MNTYIRSLKPADCLQDGIISAIARLHARWDNMNSALPFKFDAPEGLMLRRAQAADSAAIRDLFAFVHVEYGFEAEFDERDADLNDVSKAYTGPREFFAVVIRETDQKLMGSIALSQYNEREAELGRFYLYPEARGFGLGTALTRWTMEVARAWHYERVLLETHTDMTEAMGLYKKLGFREIPCYCGHPEDYSNAGFAYDLAPQPVGEPG